MVTLFNPYPFGFYKLYNVQISSIDYGGLDYKSENSITIKLFLLCDKLKY
jgi:hypothetical protein